MALTSGSEAHKTHGSGNARGNGGLHLRHEVVGIGGGNDVISAPGGDGLLGGAEFFLTLGDGAGQNSDLPVKQWCSNNDVSKDQYYYWLRKIREMTVSEIPVPVSDTVSFRRLEVKPPLTGTRQSVMIHLPQQ